MCNAIYVPTLFPFTLSHTCIAGTTCILSLTHRHTTRANNRDLLELEEFSPPFLNLQKRIFFIALKFTHCWDGLDEWATQNSMKQKSGGSCWANTLHFYLTSQHSFIDRHLNDAFDRCAFTKASKNIHRTQTQTVRTKKLEGKLLSTLTQKIIFIKEIGLKKLSFASCLLLWFSFFPADSSWAKIESFAFARRINFDFWLIKGYDSRKSIKNSCPIFAIYGAGFIGVGKVKKWLLFTSVEANCERGSERRPILPFGENYDLASSQN